MTTYSTKQVAKILGVRPDKLSRAVWIGQIDTPEKSPSGDYLWSELNIQRASWVLLHRAYEPKGASND
jgi:hypothetical protein